MSGPDHEPDRLSRLEQRVAELEQRLNAVAPDAKSLAPAPPPIPAPAWPTPPSVIAPLERIAATAAAATPAAPAIPAAPAMPAAPFAVRPASRSFAELEEQLSGRLLAWVGGIALVLGAVFFLSLAFSRGWIGPEARVLIGLVAGAAALAAGAWLFERGDQTPATVLTGVGVGTGALALFAASRLYGFVPVEAALVGFLVLAVVTAAIALRANSQAVAAFGIVATTLAPPILGASPNLATVAFLGAAIVGTALISFRRSWPWLALIAFVATAPQAAQWLSVESSTTLALGGILAFWTINALAASGSALAGVRRTVHRAQATLLVLNALFAIGSIHAILPDDPMARSAGLLILAGAHGALALELLLRPSRRHPFGVLAAGLAAGTLAIGMAIELGGIARPIGLMVEVIVVAWVGIRFRDRSAGAWAAAIGALAIGDLVLMQYPTESFGRISPKGWPFASPEGIVAVAIALGLLLVGVLAWRSFKSVPLRDRRLTAEVALAGGGIGAIAVIVYAASFELWADMLIVAWALLAGAALGLAAFVRRDPRAWLAAVIEGAALILSAGYVAVTIVAPTSRLVVDPDRLPLVDGQTSGLVALAALAMALAVAGVVFARWPSTRPLRTVGDPVAGWARGAIALSGAVIVYLVSIAIVDLFQARVGSAADAGEVATQAQVALSIVWVLLGAGAFATGLIGRISLARMFGLGLLSVATAKVFLFDLASLDVAYRVLSFIGLGGVLLASSFVAARFRAPAVPPDASGA